MKKIFISLTWLLCSMAAMAQGTGASDAFFSTERSDEDVSFSIRVGVNTLEVSPHWITGIYAELSINYILRGSGQMSGTAYGTFEIPYTYLPPKEDESPDI